MKKLILVPKRWTAIFLIGTVIFLVTVPFSFAQGPINFQPQKLKVNFPNFLFSGYSDSRQSMNPLLDTIGPVKIDTVRSVTETEQKFKMKKSPWLAVLFSTVPGMGQLYNQSYWKVPIVVGLSAYLIFEIYDNNKTFRNYRDQYSATQSMENPLGDPSLLSLRNFYRDQRDDFIWYFTIVYVINLVDAYVDAQLFDFDVKEEKIIKTGTIDRQYKLNFHLNF